VYEQNAVDAQNCTRGTSLDERRAGGIPCGISPGLEGGPDSAGGKTRSVWFALDDERFSGEVIITPPSKSGSIK